MLHAISELNEYAAATINLSGTRAGNADLFCVRSVVPGCAAIRRDKWVVKYAFWPSRSRCRFIVQLLPDTTVEITRRCVEHARCFWHARCISDTMRRDCRGLRYRTWISCMNFLPDFLNPVVPKNLVIDGRGAPLAAPSKHGRINYIV